VHPNSQRDQQRGFAAGSSATSVDGLHQGCRAVACPTAACGLLQHVRLVAAAVSTGLLLNKYCVVCWHCCLRVTLQTIPDSDVTDPQFYKDKAERLGKVRQQGS